MQRGLLTIRWRYSPVTGCHKLKAVRIVRGINTGYIDGEEEEVCRGGTDEARQSHTRTGRWGVGFPAPRSWTPPLCSSPESPRDRRCYQAAWWRQDSAGHCSLRDNKERQHSWRLIRVTHLFDKHTVSVHQETGWRCVKCLEKEKPPADKTCQFEAGKDFKCFVSSAAIRGRKRIHSLDAPVSACCCLFSLPGDVRGCVSTPRCNQPLSCGDGSLLSMTQQTFKVSVKLQGQKESNSLNYLHFFGASQMLVFF